MHTACRACFGLTCANYFGVPVLRRLRKWAVPFGLFDRCTQHLTNSPKVARRRMHGSTFWRDLAGPGQHMRVNERLRLHRTLQVSRAMSLCLAGLQ
jgi:hypothetical protein